MSDQATHHENGRREFLRACARAFLLGGLVVLGTSVTRRAGSPENDLCRNDGLCSGCARFAGCQLPPAAAARLTPPGGPP